VLASAEPPQALEDTGPRETRAQHLDALGNGLNFADRWMKSTQTGCTVWWRQWIKPGHPFRFEARVPPALRRKPTRKLC